MTNGSKVDPWDDGECQGGSAYHCDLDWKPSLKLNQMQKDQMLATHK